MSAQSSAARPAGRPSTRSTSSRTAPSRAAARKATRPQLREVPAPAPSVAGAGLFALVVTGVMAGGAVLLLVLNTTLAQGAFEMSRLEKQQRELAVQEQTLLQEVAKAESPETLARRAEALGMVPVESPVFLRLADGKVLGVPVPAKAAPRIPTTGRPATTTTRTTGAAAAAAPARPATPAAPVDAAEPDPAPVSDGAVLDAPTRATR
jgi:hypothetical protein